MRIIPKAVIALLALYGASFVTYEIQHLVRNREYNREQLNETGRSPRYRWTLVPK